MTTKLTKRDISRIEECHPVLQKLWYDCANDNKCPPFIVIDGARTVAEQRRNVAKGVSKTMNSYHIRKGTGFSHATDIAPLINDEASWDWKHYYPLAKAIKKHIADNKLTIKWGGDWKWKDGPHWQLNKHAYPWNAEVFDNVAYEDIDKHHDAPIKIAPINDNFRVSIPYVLDHEKGYVNHPKDKGGPTNKGITLATYRRYVNRNGTIADLKAMPTSVAIDVYKQHYWDKCRCDMLPDGVDHVVFDFGVNSGQAKARKMLQSIVGVKVDGVIGTKTIEAVHAMLPRQIIERFQEERLAYLKTRSNAPTFINGWTKRVNRVRKEALSMVKTAIDEKPEIKQPTPPGKGLFSIVFKLIGKLLGK